MYASHQRYIPDQSDVETFHRMKDECFVFVHTVFTVAGRITEIQALLIFLHFSLGPSSRDCLPCDFSPLLRCHGV